MNIVNNLEKKGWKYLAFFHNLQLWKKKGFYILVSLDDKVTRLRLKKGGANELKSTSSQAS